MLVQYSRIDWRSIMRMRDVISHHYYNLNSEVVYGVCKTDIEPLEREIQGMLEDLTR